MTACVCGHSVEEHGGDSNYTGSTSCSDDDCDCCAYEPDRNAEDDAIAERDQGVNK